MGTYFYFKYAQISERIFYISIQKQETVSLSHPGTYRRLFHIKALHLEFLPLEHQIFLVEHYLLHCQQVMHSKQTDKQDMTANPLKQEHMSSALRKAAFALMQLKNEQWQLELAWGQSLYEQINLRLKQHEENNGVIN